MEQQQQLLAAQMTGLQEADRYKLIAIQATKQAIVAIDRELEARTHHKQTLKNPYEWSLGNRIKIDHKPIDFSNRQALIQPYSDLNQKVLWASAAQVGKTAYILCFSTWGCERYEPAKFGFYFPTYAGVTKLVQDRYNPLVSDVPHLNRKLISKAEERAEGRVIFKIELKQFGLSSLYFFWYEGKVATESTPLDGIICDEIRLTDIMKLETIQKRLLASNLKLERYTSTWGYPGDPVDQMFSVSTQNQFNTLCSHCNHEFVMWREFENMGCIGERKVDGRPQYFYRCPRCSKEIFDINKGFWVPEKPGREMIGYHVHGMLAPARSAQYLWTRFKQAKNLKEFWNSDIGIAYLDRTKQLITKEVLDNCMDVSMGWEQNGTNCYLGADIQMEFIAVVIKRMLDNGRTKLVYITYLYGMDDKPFKELSRLMQTFDVNIAVLDGESPRAAEAREFCKAWKGRAFFVTYHQNDNLILWHDRMPKKAEERTIRDVKELDKFHVSIQKDLMLEYSLKRFVDRENVIPHGAGLIHRVKVRDIPYREMLALTGKGFDEFVPVATCMQILYPHLQQYIKEEFPEVLKIDVGGSKQDVKTGNINYRFVTKNIDPHYADANMYCDVALARKYFKMTEK